MVDEIVNQPLPPPAEQRALFLAWMREHAGDARFAELDISDSEAMAAVVGSTDSESFQKLIRWVASEGEIEVTDDGTASLTPKGWEVKGRASGAEPPASPQTGAGGKMTKGHCPNCGGTRQADTVASHEERWDDENAPVWSINTYSILRCRGCETVYVRNTHVLSEDEDYERNPATGERSEEHTS